jgi:hypothetical protein
LPFAKQCATKAKDSVMIWSANKRAEGRGIDESINPGEKMRIPRRSRP